MLLYFSGLVLVADNLKADLEKMSPVRSAIVIRVHTGKSNREQQCANQETKLTTSKYHMM